MSKKRMTVIAAASAAAVTVLIIIAIFCTRGRAQQLTLTDTESGEIYLSVPAEDGTAFAVTFTHSVNKTDVTETYEVRSGEIWLTGCIYYSFGAGVAEELDPSWTLTYGDGGEMIISDIDQRLQDLTYVVGTVSDHTLSVNGEEYSLRTLCGRNSSVRFEIS